MSDRTLAVWVGANIIYLYSTVNGEAATFTLAGDGYWNAIVPRAEDDNYVLHLEAYSANGLEGTYDYTLYYGMMPSVIDRTNTDQYGHEDLNRVGHNAQFLADLLNLYGYAVTVTTKTDWTIASDYGTVLATYLSNITALKNAFYGTVTVPTTILTHTQANDIERLLNEVETYINRMVAGFKKCGTFKSGQGVIL